jgi:serine phosphatase RsbU (regulator of sigma subunit)
MAKMEKTVSCLKWTDSHHHHYIHHLLAGETIIGRGGEADLVIRGRNVSRRHVRIAREAEGYTLTDLGSSLGTYVNGQRIERCRLRHGDRIRMGQDGSDLVYLLSDQATTVISGMDKEYDMEKSIQGLAALLPGGDSGLTSLEKISCILDFRFYWDKTFSPLRTFQEILKSALEISGAERGYILLKEPGGFRYQVGMSRTGALLAQSEFRTSRSVVRQVEKQEKPVIMTEKLSGEIAQQESIVAMNVRALACLPLVANLSSSETSEVLGILYLDSTQRMHRLSVLDQKIMTKLAEQAGAVLEKLEMLKTVEEQKKIQQDLIQAREIQRSLLPQSVPEFGNFSIHHFNHPSRHVGGDFYDFLTLDSGELVGLVADVAGKGVSAALLSSLLQGGLHMEFRSTTHPVEVLNRLNRMLCEKSPSDRFVTLFLFSLDTLGAGQFISAGHNPAYLYRAATGEIEELASGGLILGVFDFATYESRPLRLAEGDILVVYSDGLTEAQNPEGEMFGEERLQELIRREGREGSHALERKLLEDLENFHRGIAQTDDITFVLVEHCRPGAKQELLRIRSDSTEATPVPGDTPPPFKQ